MKNQGWFLRLAGLGVVQNTNNEDTRQTENYREAVMWGKGGVQVPEESGKALRGFPWWASGKDGSQNQVKWEEKESMSKRMHWRETSATWRGMGSKTRKARFLLTSKAKEKAVINLISHRSSQWRLQFWHPSKTQAEGEVRGQGEEQIQN